VVGGRGHRLADDARGRRADDAVVLQAEPEGRHQPLQDAHGVGAGVDLHVEDARLQRRRQEVDLRFAEVVADVDLRRLRRAERPDVGGIDLVVAGQVEPEPAHGVDGDAVVGRAARIVGVVDEPPFTTDDLRRDALDRVHVPLLSM
jgi:hypothetical protein